MKAFVAFVCVLMVIGISYCAWKSGALDDLLLRERDARRDNDRPPARAVPDKWERLDVWFSSRRESAAEWAERVYGDMYADSGVPEVDEANRAHRVLRTLPEDAWPHEWLRRKATSRRLVDKAPRYTAPEPSEQCVGASEVERPAWAGPRGWREETDGQRPTRTVRREPWDESGTRL